MLRSLAVSLSLLAAGLPALGQPPEGDLERGEIVSLESEIPIELDPITVTAERMPVRQEAALRLVRQAMKRPPSNRRQDIDELICWLETSTIFLPCAIAAGTLAIASLRWPMSSTAFHWPNSGSAAR